MVKERYFNMALVTCLIICLILGLAPGRAAAKTPQERIDESVKVIREMMGQEDAGAMAHVLNNAKGVAIFPSVVKAGFILGGKYGEGLILRRNSSTGKWYGPSFVNIVGASWGLQIGAQSIALVLVVNNERGMDPFLRGDSFKLGGDVAVVAGPVGRRGEAATDINLKASIYSYSMSKGLFAGLSLEGAGMKVDENANQVYWGKPTSPEKAMDTRASKKAIVRLTQELERLMAKD